MKNSDEVEVAITRRGTYHVGALTRGWTAEERALLDAGDLGALDELRNEAVAELARNPKDTELDFEIIE